MTTNYVPGYSLTMRQDKRTGEHLAFIAKAYRNHRGERYYMALTAMDGWVELKPEYATRCTRTVSDYPDDLKRRADSSLGYIMHVTPRLIA